MSGTSSRRVAEARANRPPGGFVPMPHIVVRSEQWTRLSAHGCKLLMDLLAQYNGRNNGDLCATWSLMVKRGWRSRDTLRKAQAELETWGWVARTRQGGLHAPNLFGVTFFGLDWQSKNGFVGNGIPARRMGQANGASYSDEKTRKPTRRAC